MLKWGSWNVKNLFNHLFKLVKRGYWCMKQERVCWLRKEIKCPVHPSRGPGRQHWSPECPVKPDFTWISFFHLNPCNFPPQYTFLRVAAAAAAAARSTKVNPSAINPGRIRSEWSSLSDLSCISGWIDGENPKSLVCAFIFDHTCLNRSVQFNLWELRFLCIFCLR